MISEYRNNEQPALGDPPRIFRGSRRLVGQGSQFMRLSAFICGSALLS
jgi:hypothetical protein